MARHKQKTAEQCNISYWLTAKPDGKEGRFIMVGNSFLLSERVHELPASARCVYLAMAMECGGKAHFTFPERTMKKYGFDPSTAKRAIKTLIANGFITCTCSGKNTRTANEYKFCFRWKGID